MFGANKRIASLEKEVSMLKFIQNNPPKYKVGEHIAPNHIVIELYPLLQYGDWMWWYKVVDKKTGKTEAIK